jgi:hypothetical protein
MGSVTAPTPQSGSELVIGLVAAVGTEHDRLTEYLEEILKTFKYRVEIVRLAALLHPFPRYKKLPSGPVDEYIDSHQRAGDEFRELMGRHDALAILGLGEIRRKRIDLSGDENKVVPRCAYIIRSLKTPEEVQTLREVYGNAFLLVGSSAPYELRRKYLASKIASSRHSFQSDQYLPRAEELIQRDQEEADEEFGQNLRNAFHLADVFVDCSDNLRLHSSLERVLALEAVS